VRPTALVSYNCRRINPLKGRCVENRTDFSGFTGNPTYRLRCWREEYGLVKKLKMRSVKLNMRNVEKPLTHALPKTVVTPLMPLFSEALSQKVPIKVGKPDEPPPGGFFIPFD